MNLKSWCLITDQQLLLLMRRLVLEQAEDSGRPIVDMGLCATDPFREYLRYSY